MYVKLNGFFEIIDDDRMIAKKELNIIGSEFYSTENTEKENMIWSPGLIDIADDIALKYEINITSKIKSKK